MSHDEIDGDLGISRRQLIRRGAVVGGTVLWAAPVVQSLTTPALGQTLYPGTGCQCTSTACALRVSGLAILNACGGNPCVANANVGVGGGTITAGTLCATTEATAGGDNVCNASASVAQLNVTNVSVAGLIGPLNIAATVLNRTLAAPCNCAAPTAGGSIASLTINGQNALTGTGRATLQALGIVVLVNPAPTCQNGVWRTAAVDINVVNALRIVVAEVTTRAANCACPA